MSTKIFDAALGLIKLSHNQKVIKSKSKVKEEFSKSVLNRICELTINPSENTQLDLSILLCLDIKIVRNQFLKFRLQKQKKKNHELEEDYVHEETTDIPATMILQIVYLVRDLLNGRSKMRYLK
ncbi:hypothetical protein P3W45_001521 [Vairimorpha bombi]|jgi:hypothetical protein